jgi:hypothetical protein
LNVIPQGGITWGFHAADHCNDVTHATFLTSPRTRLPAAIHAFSLLEVTIALGIFFMAAFAILGLVSSVLTNARMLERPQVDAGLAASHYVNTNRFFEETTSGDFGGDALRDYSWEINTYEPDGATNGLLQADIFLLKRGAHRPVDTLSILVWDPNFKSGPFGGRRP